MSQFEIAHFEDRVEALIEAYRVLLHDYEALKSSYEQEQARNRETRERLNGVIERIRALEAEADNA
ncbi:hypothetical protein T35B1_14274 [Salinisphaera shabanensis T35B1]|jgi:chromosome segregation ATPase|uniref:hypothetical protein n=1 Tax=Salinisphaera shabanensis TaxID=180542 RepID=UPI00333F24B6